MPAKRSPTRIIEATPQLRKLEASFDREPGGELRHVSTLRTPFETTRAIKTGEIIKTDLHTHPDNLGTRFFQALFLIPKKHVPSIQDLSSMAHRFKYNKTRHFHISILGFSGKEIGRVSIMLTNTFISLIDGPIWSRTLMEWQENNAGPADALKDLIRSGLVKARFTTIPGYEFNKTRMKFIRKKNK